MNKKASVLWEKLAEQQLVSGEPPTTQSLPATPWYLRAMLGFMGWIGAILFLGVLWLGLHTLLDSNLWRFVIGGIMGSIAIQLYRGEEDQDLRMQFALALGLCAQLLVIWALTDAFSGQPVTIALVIMALELILWASIDNSTVRFGTAAAATTALVFILYHYQWNAIIIPLLITAVSALWLNEFSLFRYRQRLLPAAWAITLVALLMLSKNDFSRWLGVYPGDLSTTSPLLLALQIILTLTAVANVSHRLLKEQNKTLLSVFGLLSTGLMLLLCFAIPGIGFSLLLALLGFGRGNHLLLGLSLAAMLYHLSKYYYLLEISLLNKSILLISCGILLLLLRRAFLYHYNKTKAQT